MNKFTVSHSQINSNSLKDSESPNLSLLRSVFPAKRLKHRIILATIHIPLEVTHPSIKKVTSSQPLGVSLVPEHPGKRHVDPGLKVYGLRVERCTVHFSRKGLWLVVVRLTMLPKGTYNKVDPFVQMRNYSNFKDGSWNTCFFIIRTSADHVKLYIAGGDIYILTPCKSNCIAAIVWERDVCFAKRAARWWCWTQLLDLKIETWLQKHAPLATPTLSFLFVGSLMPEKAICSISNCMRHK